MEQIEQILRILENVEKIEIRASAYKHGISGRDIRHAVRFHYDWLFLDEDPDKIVFVGYDSSLRNLEVVVVEFDNGQLCIVHAMRIQRSTISKIEESKHEIR